MASNPIDDGGPAFPIAPNLHEGGVDSYWTQHPASGLTKRELFAAMLAAGALAHPKSVGIVDKYTADIAVENADALLAAFREPR